MKCSIISNISDRITLFPCTGLSLQNVLFIATNKDLDDLTSFSQLSFQIIMSEEKFLCAQIIWDYMKREDPLEKV